MQVERVIVTPRKDVYNPGDVINMSVSFDTAFIGQVAVGLAPRERGIGEPFRATPLAKSSNSLYEGQVYIWQVDVGACRLVARLTPVKGEPTTIGVGDEIFWIRPLVPAK